MAKIYVEQNEKIRNVIQALQDGEADSNAVLEVVRILLGRMEYNQKTKLGVPAILEEYFSDK
jgi:hypothetical protein